VPGYHRKSASAFSDWGIERLANVLRQNVKVPASCPSQLILQVFQFMQQQQQQKIVLSIYLVFKSCFFT
jgi:hypothetical protein